ncbi:MAG TPA: D-Ala-D-Ala carboxypeptidase family metallohydrolase [Rhodothermales bacterium]|nr:D-Ala-D-Ala carboxypeptidase family metallohydrolase [Rhodothermales bacterium]
MTRFQKTVVVLFVGLLLAGIGLSLPLLHDALTTDPEFAQASPPGVSAPMAVLPPTALPMLPVDPPVVPTSLEPSPLALDTSLFAVPPPPSVTDRFSSGKASFAVQVKDEVIPYRIFGVFVMPGETLDIEAVFTERPRNTNFAAPEGKTEQIQPDEWRWTAPDEPGIYPVNITDATAGEAITLNVFVKTPFNPKSTSLNGYKIGQYELKPLRDNPVYNPPRGFVEVTPANRDTRVSPHFTLGQFLCKQQSDWPKYILLRERLALKLEMILEQVNEQGIDAQTLHVMSAFRTPWYNAAIGNTTTYSRHLYGGAADIFVDTDSNNNMDDLTDDGRVTTADANVLAAIVEANLNEVWYQPFIGGLGIYSPASHRGPFIHVDVRGQRARW